MTCMTCLTWAAGGGALAAACGADSQASRSHTGCSMPRATLTSAQAMPLTQPMKGYAM